MASRDPPRASAARSSGSRRNQGRKRPRREYPPFSPSPPEHVREHEGRHDRRVGLDDEPRRLLAELPPSDLLVRDGAAVAPEARRGVADLAEVRPQRNPVAPEVLVEHRDYADREIARDA